jgi:murein DD-endopeptidase MepM/ murein hydrolase activator NlpD
VRLLVTLPLLPLALACAATRVMWSDVDTVPAAMGNAVGAPANGRRIEPRGRGALSAGVRIDRALQRFVSARADTRSRSETSPVWSAAWTEALRSIAAASEIPPRASDLGAFVRARVTLEVELERDRTRGVILPGGLDKMVAAVLASVDDSVSELRIANAPGTLAPSPRLEPGELVLHAPTAPIIVSSPFGVRRDPFTGARRFHAGADLDAPEGSSVYAAASGLIVYAGHQGGYGKQVVVDHGDGVRTHYSHLSSILVSPGHMVEEGDAIAYVGSTGRSTGPHLHFAVTNADGEFLDPVAVLDVPYSSIAGQVKVGGNT